MNEVGRWQNQLAWYKAAESAARDAARVESEMPGVCPVTVPAKPHVDMVTTSYVRHGQHRKFSKPPRFCGDFASPSIPLPHGQYGQFDRTMAQTVQTLLYFVATTLKT